MKYIIVTFLFTFSLFAYSNTGEVKKMRKVAQETNVLIEDVVYKLIKSGNDHKVLFVKHSGIYYLRENSKNYELILKALENSKKSGQAVHVKADAYSLDIQKLVLKTN
jgi:hypothetical protein